MFEGYAPRRKLLRKPRRVLIPRQRARKVCDALFAPRYATRCSFRDEREILGRWPMEREALDTPNGRAGGRAGLREDFESLRPCRALAQLRPPLQFSSHYCLAAPAGAVDAKARLENSPADFSAELALVSPAQGGKEAAPSTEAFAASGGGGGGRPRHSFRAWPRAGQP